MALSKEFYLEEIKSKYPNSYNESLKDLPIKDLEDMLDFLDQALGKADGGAIGIEVLFTDKKPRKNFFMGGPALTGQPLAIYNSMNAYGFSDQEIANAIREAGYELPTSTSTQPEQVTGIINQQINQGGGGGGGIAELQETFTTTKGSTPQVSEDAFFGLGKFLQGKERGTLGTRLANQPRLPLPASIAAYSMSPFNPDSKNYNPDFVDQLNFLELGEDMIGRDPGTGGLKYGSGSVLRGQNVISGFGSNNYLSQLNKYINRTNITKKARQRGIDERNKFLAAEKKRKAAEEKERKAKAAAEALYAAQGKSDPGDQSRKGASGRRPGSGGDGPGTQDSGGSTGGYSYDSGGRQGFGYGLRDGGLATMFKKKR